MKLSTSEKKLLLIIINGETIPKDKKGRVSILLHKAITKLVSKSLLIWQGEDLVIADPEKVKALLKV